MNTNVTGFGEKKIKIFWDIFFLDRFSVGGERVNKGVIFTDVCIIICCVTELFPGFYSIK